MSKEKNFRQIQIVTFSTKTTSSVACGASFPYQGKPNVSSPTLAYPYGLGTAYPPPFFLYNVNKCFFFFEKYVNNVEVSVDL